MSTSRNISNCRDCIFVFICSCFFFLFFLWAIVLKCSGANKICQGLSSLRYFFIYYQIATTKKERNSKTNAYFTNYSFISNCQIDLLRRKIYLKLVFLPHALVLGFSHAFCTNRKGRIPANGINFLIQKSAWFQYLRSNKADPY